MKKLTTEEERQEILRQYRHLIDVWTTRKETKDLWDVRKAFRMAAEAHKDMRRKSGEPYIMHPIAVATIVAGEMGLGRTSIISALLHDTVEDTDITLEDVEKMFGQKVSRIIDGLTKIDEISDNNSTAQSATLKKIILTLSDDVRVILVKLADRLHNLRTLDVMPRNKQLRIASETLYIYAPLAYRLGFFAVKSELEELSFRYSQPELYEEIKKEIDAARSERYRYLNDFMVPIRKALNEKGLKFELLINEKTTYSVWKKMRRLELPFEQIYNTFSLDIIVDVESEDESLECWAVYSELAKIYKPNNKRLRDWMSTPKANGYEAIHTTVMGPQGQWVAVHIRSRRMQEIAQKGYAAYLKYKKQESSPGSLELWLKKTRELLNENDQNDESISFIDDFKQDLFSDEIYVFTPKGDMVSLPKGATVLDFAYAIHSDLGNRAIGANVNRQVKTIDSKLRSGDQVEIITSQIAEPQEEWYKNVVTARAKTKIKAALKNKRKTYREAGEKKLQEYFSQLKIEMGNQPVQTLMKELEITSPIDFYYYLAMGEIGKEDIRRILLPEEDKSRWFSSLRIPFINRSSKSSASDESPVTQKTGKVQEPGKEYLVSSCCHPVPGDNVIALELPSGRTEVHRTDCEKAIQLMSVYGRNILKSEWKPQEGKTYLALLHITAKDRPGLLNTITEIISMKYQLDMNAINMYSHEGLVFIDIKIFVPDLLTLKKLISSLSKVSQVIKVVRTF
ncbi:RelA/SpoT family protein [Candidatus Sulfidibacterium hydrothermale]|uniref:RelA/SpoT family protein n=1 Tax=Candidatus Sulfidibacterium hydrothermale TaxID=2875962 RepID=UPI001F0AA15D|nr:RelA/SpoT family protein [Candidatus Sulfidibacterium hydrothermale]UBM61833.1 RelA/SpoT family protein [Candidatus Sulfidibacterium hydrothermale]